MNKLNKMMRFNDLGIATADALIPDGVDMEKWAVLACDQHTDDSAYWERVKEYVGDAPSTLSLVYPEVQLHKDTSEKQQEKIQEIAANMKQAVKTCYTEVIEKQTDGMVFVRRQTSTGVRQGIILSIDLKQVGENGYFRPSEAVIEERVAIRAQIRKEAMLELPHIIMFANDADNLLFGDTSLYEKTKVYDFDLMEGGGHIEGYDVRGEGVYQVTGAVKTLLSRDDCLFVVGDGNHALMAAKRHYDEMEAYFGELFLKDHPLRYCTVEVVNIYDPSIAFQGIHRVFCNVDVQKAVGSIKEKLGADKITEGKAGYVNILADGFTAGIQCTQQDLYALQEAVESLGVTVDYNNDEAAAKAAAIKPGNMALLMPVIEKDQLFSLVKENGVLPKKSFSMGKAEDKRYYLEARRIMK